MVLGMRKLLAFRWALFLLALLCFVYFVFFDSRSWTALALFFLSGGFWYWRERRKMLELDALRDKGGR